MSPPPVPHQKDRTHPLPQTHRSSPIPYHALSNLLTLFSHDVPTLPLIQHLFDWLLSREPVMVVYLCAAVSPFPLSAAPLLPSFSPFFGLSFPSYKPDGEPR